MHLLQSLGSFDWWFRNFIWAVFVGLVAAYLKDFIELYRTRLRKRGETERQWREASVSFLVANPSLITVEYQFCISRLLRSFFFLGCGFVMLLGVYLKIVFIDVPRPEDFAVFSVAVEGMILIAFAGYHYYLTAKWERVVMDAHREYARNLIAVGM